MIDYIKANWKQLVAAAVTGFILGAFTIGPMAAGIQYLKDKYKMSQEVSR